MLSAYVQLQSFLAGEMAFPSEKKNKSRDTSLKIQYLEIESRVNEVCKGENKFSSAPP